jgi:predicted  nucleic acid-binding Zn-ribbon protein
MNERIEVLRRLQSIDTKLKRLEGDKLYRSYDIQKKQNQIQQKKTELSKIG